MSFDLKAALYGIFKKEKYDVGDDYSQFAVNAYLGRYPQYIGIVNRILSLKLPNKAHYEYMRREIPYGWPKKIEFPEIKKDPMLEYVMRYYECSRLDALEYLKELNDFEKENLRDYYEGEQ